MSRQQLILTLAVRLLQDEGEYIGQVYNGVLDSWIKGDELDVTSFFISLFNAQHVSDINTFILRNLRLICWVIPWFVLLWYDVCGCYGVVRLGWCGILMQAEALLVFRLQPATGYHTTPAEPHRNTNTHQTRATHIKPEQHTSNQSNTTHEINPQ
jgi:hypothetical protein